MGVLVECTRALAELRDMAELYANSKARIPSQVTVIRLEQIEGDYGHAMSRLFDALLPSLGLAPSPVQPSPSPSTPLLAPLVATPAGVRVGNSTHPAAGVLKGSMEGRAARPTIVDRAPSPWPTRSVHLTERLGRAVSRFDLSRNAPTADKAAHISAKSDKQALRDVLMRDAKLRPLLKGLRQVLDYESRPVWQPPPDVQRLSAAVDDVLSAFWKGLLSGRLGSRLANRTHSGMTTSGKL